MVFSDDCIVLGSIAGRRISLGACTRIPDVPRSVVPQPSGRVVIAARERCLHPSVGCATVYGPSAQRACGLCRPGTLRQEGRILFSTWIMDRRHSECLDHETLPPGNAARTLVLDVPPSMVPQPSGRVVFAARERCDKRGGYCSPLGLRIDCILIAWIKRRGYQFVSPFWISVNEIQVAGGDLKG